MVVIIDDAPRAFHLFSAACRLDDALREETAAYMYAATRLPRDTRAYFYFAAMLAL